MNRFAPPPYLANAHVQTIANSMKTRRLLLLRRAGGMLRASTPHILDCGEGVRLLGCHSPQKKNPGPLCILIHGWEGDAASSYLLSAAGYLWNHGFSILRLNLRDHGPTHHLNRGLFHGCRLREVIGAVHYIQEHFPFQRLFLAGFSLGGNFALRVGSHARESGLQMERIAAVCPVLHPEHAITALERGFPLYHWYFTKKWLRSLEKKHRLFPDMIDMKALSRFRSIRSLTEYFVSRYMDFANADEYLNAYALLGDRLSGLEVPATIIASTDDPVIPHKDLDLLAGPASLSVEELPRGGHCGFIQDLWMTSWADERLRALFSEKAESRNHYREGEKNA